MDIKESIHKKPKHKKPKYKNYQITETKTNCCYSLLILFIREVIYKGVKLTREHLTK